MTQDTDLLPCPFCGNAPKVQEPQTVECWSGIYCNCLDMPKPAMWQAVEKWNTRTPSSTRANERGDLDKYKKALVEISKWSQELQDRVVKDDVALNYWRACVAKATLALQHTPQPSPQSEMVAVPREVITDLQGTLNYIAVQGKANHPGFAQVARMNAEDAVKRLQPYTKGE